MDKHGRYDSHKQTQNHSHPHHNSKPGHQFPPNQLAYQGQAPPPNPSAPYPIITTHAEAGPSKRGQGHRNFLAPPPPSTPGGSTTTASSSLASALGRSATETNNSTTTTGGMTSSDAEAKMEQEKAAEMEAHLKNLKEAHRIVLAKRTSLLLVFVLVMALCITGIVIGVQFVDTNGIPPTPNSKGAFNNALYALGAQLITATIGLIILKFRISNLLIGFMFMFLLVVCFIFPAKSISNGVDSLKEDTDVTIKQFAQDPDRPNTLHKFWAAAQTKHQCCGTREIDRVEDWSFRLNSRHLPASCCKKEWIDELKRRAKATKLPESHPLVKNITRSCALGLGHYRTRGEQFKPYQTRRRLQSGFYLSLTEAEKKLQEKVYKVIVDPENYYVDRYHPDNETVDTLPATEAFLLVWKQFYMDSICNTGDYKEDVAKKHGQPPPPKGVGKPDAKGWIPCADRPEVYENDMCYPGDWSRKSAKTLGWINSIVKIRERCEKEGSGFIKEIEDDITTTTTTTTVPPTTTTKMTTTTTTPTTTTTTKTTTTTTPTTTTSKTTRTTTRVTTTRKTTTTTTKATTTETTTTKKGLTRHTNCGCKCCVIFCCDLKKHSESITDCESLSYVKPKTYQCTSGNNIGKWSLTSINTKRKRDLSGVITDPNGNTDNKDKERNETGAEFCERIYPQTRQNATVLGRELLLYIDYVTSYIYEFGMKLKSPSSTEKVPANVPKYTWILWPIPTKFHPDELYPFKLSANLNRIPNTSDEKEANRLAKKMYYFSRGISENFVMEHVIHEKTCEYLDEKNHEKFRAKLARDMNRRFRLWGPDTQYHNSQDGLGYFFVELVHNIVKICIGVSSGCIFFTIVIAVVFWQYYSRLKQEDYANLELPKEFEVLNLRRESMVEEAHVVMDKKGKRQLEMKLHQRRLFKDKRVHPTPE